MEQILSGWKFLWYVGPYWIGLLLSVAAANSGVFGGESLMDLSALQLVGLMFGITIFASMSAFHKKRTEALKVVHHTKKIQGVVTRFRNEIEKSKQSYIQLEDHTLYVLDQWLLAIEETTERDLEWESHKSSLVRFMRHPIMSICDWWKSIGKP